MNDIQGCGCNADPSGRHKDCTLTLGFEDDLGEDTAAPVVEHVGYPVTQSEDRHRGEVQSGQNLLIPGGDKCLVKVVTNVFGVVLEHQ